MHTSALPAASAAGATVHIFAITSQDDFLLELGAVLAAGAAAVHPVQSLAAALERIGAARHAHVFAFDTRGMVGLRNIVGYAYARAPQAVILLFADAADAQRLRGAFAGSRVFAILPLSVQPARTARVLAEALRTARASAAARTAAAEPMPAAAVPYPHRWRLGVTLALPVLAAAALIARDKPSAVQNAAPARAAIAAVHHGHRDARMEQLLAKARTAMAGKRYSEPAGDSALLYYRTAMAADPADPEASQGLARLAAILVERFGAQLQQSQLDAAQATLAAFKSAAPQDARGAAMAARLLAARTASMHAAATQAR